MAAAAVAAVSAAGREEAGSTGRRAEQEDMEHGCIRMSKPARVAVQTVGSSGTRHGRVGSRNAQIEI